MYRAISEMTTNPSLTNRITACLATLSVPDPRTAAAVNVYRFAAMPGWADAWQSAVDSYNVNQNPDTGARTDVITDPMILAAADAVWRADPTSPFAAPADIPVPPERAVAADPTLSPEQGGPTFEIG